MKRLFDRVLDGASEMMARAARSLEEIEKIKKLIRMKLEFTDEELSEDDLFAIAGGCDPLTCIVLPVLLAVTALGGTAIFEFTEIKW